MGLDEATTEAKTRWKESGYATQVYHFEDYNMIWNLEGTKARVLSLTELCKIQGFPGHYLDGTQEIATKFPDAVARYNWKRDALGNAFTVQVIQRLLLPIINMFDILPVGIERPRLSQPP